MLGNVYIGLVNWIDWIKKKKISSVDYILTSLAISRICLLCILILNVIIMICYPDFYENDKLQTFISIFWTLTNYLSTWFATCLLFAEDSQFLPSSFSLDKAKNRQSDSLDSAALFGHFVFDQPYTSNDTRL